MYAACVAKIVLKDGVELGSCTPTSRRVKVRRMFAIRLTYKLIISTSLINTAVMNLEKRKIP